MNIKVSNNKRRRTQTLLVFFIVYLWVTLDLSFSQSKQIRVLAIHDFHGTLFPREYNWSDGRPIGGAATLKTIMDTAEAECKCPTFRLDGGDQMQGTLASNLTKGASTVKVFNVIGIDAAAVGNHELDWGIDTFINRQSEANYAWLAANVFETRTGHRPKWALPYTILDKSGVRVAIIGFMTTDTKYIVSPSTVAGLEFRGGLSGIQDALEEVQRHSPDFTIVLAHAGAWFDGTIWRGEIMETAKSLVPGSVDLIVSGHSHAFAKTVQNGIPIIQAGSNGRAVGIVDLIKTLDGSLTFNIRVDTVFADQVCPDTTVLKTLALYQSRVDSLAKLKITTLKGPLTRLGAQHALGNLIADVIRTTASADVAVTNNGGIRADLPAGPVNYGQIYEVLPFGNKIVRIDLPGRILKKVLEHTVSRQDPWCHISGIRVTYAPQASIGNRIKFVEFLDGQLIHDEDQYTLATSDFLASGAEGFTMVTNLSQKTTDMTRLEALVSYLQNAKQPVDISFEQRFLKIAE